MRAFLTVLLFLTAAAPAVAQSRGQASDPSFDCRRAPDPVERVICGRPELGALDRKLSDLYADAPKSADVVAAQRAWVLRRDGCARSESLDWFATCVGAAYRERIAALEFGGAPADEPEPARSGPSFDCRRASDPMESLICSDATLSMLDAELSRVYVRRRAADPSVGPTQQDWIAERDSCLGSPWTATICVAAAYRRRISELE